jgi:hypothetical protein
MHSRYFDEPEVNSAKSTPSTMSAASHAPSLVFGAVLGVPPGAPEATVGVGVRTLASGSTGEVWRDGAAFHAALWMSERAPEATVGCGGAKVDVGATVLLACATLASGSMGEVWRVGAAFHASLRATSDAALWSSERARAAIGATRSILALRSRMYSHTYPRSPLTEVSAQ